MCGIVGYIGPKNPKDVIVAGLKRLEYRGYDSAGVAILNEGLTKRIRAEGKLKALEEKLLHEQFTGHIGIGHTRWATHGAPTERNAHPHFVRGVSLVHNGIIENYAEIREELLKAGATITSDTDSELVAHLVANAMDRGLDLLRAVQSVLESLTGAFSIVVMSEKEPETLVAFKDGPPLVVGVGEKELFVVSDVQAALSHTNRFIYLDDREIVAIHGQQYEIYSSRGVKISKPVVEIKWSADLVEKQGFSHYMLKEIHEQPRAVSAAIEPHVDQREFRIRLSRLGFGGTPTTELEKIHQPTDFADTEKVLTQLQRVFIVACGTSYYAGLIGKYLIENLAGVPVEIDVASEFRYRNPVLPEKTLVLTISQSGETADTLAAIRMAKEKNCLTLSICNVKNSTIDREANGHLYMNSGPEIGVASTKAFTSTIALLDCLAIQMGTLRGKISSDQEAQLVKSLLAIPNQMAVVLAHDKYFAKAAKVLNQFKGFLYIGRGSSYPVALEGALKLKELAYLHAEGYAAGEMKHGPLALIDERMGIVTIAPHDHLYEKTMSNIEEAKARGGKIIAIGNQEDDKLRKMSEHYISIPATHWTVSALLSVIPVQLMAFHLANNLGYDVDQPRNLAKSVTVE